MSNFRKGLRDGIPIALGYLSVSFTFGLQCISVGLNWWQAFLISLTNVTSAGQFAGLGIMTAGSGLFEMACTQLVINMRYALMALSLVRFLLAIFFVVFLLIKRAGVMETNIFCKMSLRLQHIKKRSLIV